MIPSSLIVLAVFAVLFCTRLAVSAAVFHGGHFAAAAIIGGCYAAALYFTDSTPEPPAPGASELDLSE
jgi:hypothetical protein